MTSVEQRDSWAFLVLCRAVCRGLCGLHPCRRRLPVREERLGLLWRKWQTQRLTTTYLARRTYYRLDAGGLIANADQRITDDVRAYTTTTLSFVLMMLNATFTVLAFSGVLWTISPSLFAVAVGYAAVGSLAAIYLGRPLVRLNYTQLDKEANFRAALIHVRENAESVALLHREGRLRARLGRGLEELTNNYRRIIAVNRNLGFFTTGYNYLIQIIPAVIVAPLYIREEVEFGVITQSAMAFAQLLGAFSLIVTQFQSISSFAAVLARLNALNDAFQQAHAPVTAGIEVREEAGRLAYDQLTLRSPRDGRALVADLSITIPRGTRLLVLGPDDTAKVALFRATASMWDTGEGRISVPASTTSCSCRNDRTCHRARCAKGWCGPARMSMCRTSASSTRCTSWSSTRCSSAPAGWTSRKIGTTSCRSASSRSSPSPGSCWLRRSSSFWITRPGRSASARSGNCCRPCALT